MQDCSSVFVVTIRSHQFDSRNTTTTTQPPPTLTRNHTYAQVGAGQTLAVGAMVGGVGVRGYLAVRGGIDVPTYLGSRSTFPGGKFGGYQGRYLRVGDSLPLAKGADAGAVPCALPAELVPEFGGGRVGCLSEGCGLCGWGRAAGRGGWALA